MDTHLDNWFYKRSLSWGKEEKCFIYPAIHFHIYAHFFIKYTPATMFHISLSNIYTWWDIISIFFSHNLSLYGCYVQYWHERRIYRKIISHHVWFLLSVLPQQCTLKCTKYVLPKHSKHLWFLFSLFRHAFSLTYMKRYIEPQKQSSLSL